mmetsp:Transcript_143425/g.275461  ORF Transcript_143425/g.275461 Transcript_143425/m.275461 type:complete len:539 (-) Transcript_143425:9-1625(-)
MTRRSLVKRSSSVKPGRVKGYVCVAVGIALLCASIYSKNQSVNHPASLARRLGDGGCEGPNDVIEEAVADEAADIKATKPTVGKFLLHSFGLIYMFIALYIVCDEFFVPALDKLSSVLGLSPDVAGATFMAAGGSAPEFFTSLVSAFSTTSSDTGIAAIVGSAVFNVLFVIGACGLAAPGTLKLTGYPLTRDCTFYLVDLVLLWVFFSDGQILWWEALILFLLYVAYAVYMAFSGRVEEYLAQRMDKKQALIEFERLDVDKSGGVSMKEMGDDAKFKRLDRNSDGIITLQEFEWELRSQRNYAKQQEDAEEDADNNPISPCPPGYVCYKDEDDSESEEESAEGGGFSILGILWYILTLPLVLVLWLTVPDVRRGGCWEKMYIPGFFLSIGWIAVFSKFMVDFSETVGAFTTLPTRILAVTLLAWGTSIPDLLTSVLVTWQGHGDMAVSSSIGSNIFDVTVGLPVPWLLAIIINGAPVEVDANGISFWILLLLGMVFAVIGGIACTGWVLSKALGSLFIVLFLVVMVLMILSTMCVINV